MKKAKVTSTSVQDVDDPLAQDLTGYLCKLKWKECDFIFKPKVDTLAIRLSGSTVDLENNSQRGRGKV